MSTSERKQKIYERRRAKREEKASQYDKTLEEIFTVENVRKASERSCNNVRWKSRTKEFEYNMEKEVHKIRNEILSGKRRFKGYQSFSVLEHGKLRDIDALKIAERAGQKTFHNNFLLPLFSKSFIYENGACLKDRGMDFQLKVLKKQMVKHYKQYGLAGGILQFDFKGYFDSIPHEEMRKIARKTIKDDAAYNLFCSYIEDFKNRRTYANNDRGMNLGSEISAIMGLIYASPLDHYIKEKLHIKGYGRYNDDGYIISHSLEELEQINEEIKRICDKLQINLNLKKTKITPFKHHSFSFLKRRIFFDAKTGKVIMKLNRISVKNQRQKLKRLKKKLKNKEMVFEDIVQSYQSWRSYARKNNSFATVKNMDKFFISLFSYELSLRKKKFKCYCHAYKKNNRWYYVANNEEKKDE